MAIEYTLVQTTLSSALSATASTVDLTSVTGVNNGDILVIGNEVLKVSDPTATLANPIGVLRGWDGTASKAHANASVVWHDEPDGFRATHNRGREMGLVGVSGALPTYLIPGQRAFDGAGNEYISVTIIETGGVYSGVSCTISKDGLYTAVVTAAATQGSVGLATEQASSDQLTWLQIYGYNAAAQMSRLTSAATSAYVAVAASSVSTPPAGMEAFLGTTVEAHLIYGMFIVGAASSATTSAASFVGLSVPVFLNYPYVRHYVDFTMDPTS